MTLKIWQEICKYLPIEDIHSVLRLNKYINQIDKYIWESLLHRDFDVNIEREKHNSIIQIMYNTPKNEYKLFLTNILTFRISKETYQPSIGCNNFGLQSFKI